MWCTQRYDVRVCTVGAVVGAGERVEFGPSEREMVAALTALC